MVAIPLETVASAEARAIATEAAAAAYTDAAVVAASGGNSHWSIQVLPWLNWKAASATPTRTQSSTRVGAAFLGTTNASGNWIEYSVPLDAGTWTITLIHDKGASYGQCDVKVDGTTVGSINQYNASTQNNQVTEITGVVVGSNGDHTVRFVNTGTGGGASYSIFLGALGFQRTA